MRALLYLCSCSVPWYGPYARWCRRGGAVRRPPYPDFLEELDKDYGCLEVRR